MRARRDISVRLWGASFALALSLNAATAVALLTHWHLNADQVANAPVITVDLAPVPAAPRTANTEMPPGPRQSEQSETRPQPDSQRPVKQTEIPPQPRAARVLTALPPPRPIETPKESRAKQQHASLASAPASAERKVERPAAPAPGASAHNPDAVPNWKSRLIAALERNKRYPPQAEARGEHGTAELAFSVDRHGGVHRARILRSSGSSLLDAATLTMLRRAVPLPPPPPELAGVEIPIEVPIRYNIR